MSDETVIHDDDTGRDFHVGGVDRELTEKEQFEQINWYFNQHYPSPSMGAPWSEHPGDRAESDAYGARRSDRLTHAAMMVLGAAVDHRMPGAAFADAIERLDVHSLPHLAATQFSPSSSEASGTWAITLHDGGWWRGGAEAREMVWQPEVAAAAALSGATVLDLDYPLAPEHTLSEVTAAVRATAEYARKQGATRVVGWGASSGAALAALCADAFDALILQRPDFNLDRLPESFRGDVDYADPATWPERLVQVGTEDTQVARWPEAEAQVSGGAPVEVREYTAAHQIIVPAVARRRLEDAAEFLGR